MTDIDTAYTERARLIDFACRLAATIGLDYGYLMDPSDPGWPVVLVDLPGGRQVTWHVSAEDFAAHLSWLPNTAHQWDGHDTEQKWRRCEGVANSFDAPLLARIEDLEARAAAAAAMREALILTDCWCEREQDPGSGQVYTLMECQRCKALSSDAGREMLERLRRAESDTTLLRNGEVERQLKHDRTHRGRRGNTRTQTNQRTPPYD